MVLVAQLFSLAAQQAHLRMTHKQISAKGGKVRAEKLTAEQRQKIARKGGMAKAKNRANEGNPIQSP